jgi:serine/threonine protein kinase
VLHRDLKPANILLGEGGWKIADFGFAMLTENKIKSRYNVGTPLYMPPEALVESIYSPLSDIFSVGIILYELLVGRTPW